MPIGLIWQTFLETPLINFLIALSVVSFGSYGMAILVFTVITRLVTFPLTIRTLRATRKMQEVQPRLQEIQKKYSDPKRRTEETMKLYRESGVNPLGCLGPQLIQMPLFIALYQVIRITLGGTPEAMLSLEGRLYDFDFLRDAIPLSRTFLFIDLGATGNIPLVIIVFAGMWLQQRISGSRNTARDSQQAQMNQTMQWMMPAIFAWFSLVVPAGLALYWAATTVIGIVLQWVFIGPGDFRWGQLIPNVVRERVGLPPLDAAPTHRPAASTNGARADIAGAELDADIEARSSDGTGSRSQRSRRRGRGRASTESARPDTRSSRRRRRPRG